MKTNMQYDDMENNQFIGSWRLVSYEVRDTDNLVTYPLGEGGIGYLIYTPDGYMSVTLMKANRPKFADGDVLGGSIEEQAMAFQTYSAYCGRYEIQTNKVIHHVEASLFPNWVGVDHERFFEFKNNRLSLTTPPFLMSGKQQVNYLLWERISKA